MTPDELLEQIEKHSAYAWGNAGEALRAVVELHKPVQSYMFDEKACSHCSSEDDRSEILYPCPTIEAIEKELG